MVIPAVVVTDLLFAAVAAVLYRFAPSLWSRRRLVAALFVYTLIEAAFHVPYGRARGPATVLGEGVLSAGLGRSLTDLWTLERPAWRHSRELAC